MSPEEEERKLSCILVSGIILAGMWLLVKELSKLFM